MAARSFALSALRDAAKPQRLPKVDYVEGRRPTAPVVLLPGLFAGAWIWQSTWDFLASNGFAVLQVTEPLATLEVDVPSIETLRNVLTGVLDEYGIERATLCGNSLGGLMALDFAAHCPARVERAVVSGCPGLGKTANLRLSSAGHISHHAVGEIADKFFYNRSKVGNDMIEKSYSMVADRRCAKNMLRFLHSIREYDVRYCLSRIKCDVLMMWGENDRITPAEEWERNLHLLAKGALRKLPQCGHVPMMEQPGEFNAILEDFLGGCPAASTRRPVPCN